MFVLSPSLLFPPVKGGRKKKWEGERKIMEGEKKIRMGDKLRIVC